MDNGERPGSSNKRTGRDEGLSTKLQNLLCIPSTALERDDTNRKVLVPNQVRTIRNSLPSIPVEQSIHNDPVREKENAPSVVQNSDRTNFGSAKAEGLSYVNQFPQFPARSIDEYNAITNSGRRFAEGNEHNTRHSATNGPVYRNIYAQFKRICPAADCTIDICSLLDTLTRAMMACDAGKETPLSYSMKLDKGVKAVLKSHFIETLTRKTFKFPRAKFYCTACNYHMDSILFTVEHLHNSRHSSLEKSQRMAFTFDNIPHPVTEQCEAIEETLNHVWNNHGLHPDSMKHRYKVLERVNELILQKTDLDCTAELFGSSVSGLGFSQSDININISFCNNETVVDKCKSPGQINLNSTPETYKQISELADAIRNEPKFCDVQEKFSSSKSIITFSSKVHATSIECAIQFGNSPAVLLAMLLNEYCKLDPRVEIMAVGLRHFAKICCIDDQDNGFFPSHCYTVMVIHFLQECNVLPVLHCVPTLDSSRPFASAEEAMRGGFSRTEICGPGVLGRFWVKMLRYYALEFDYQDRVVTISRPEPLRRTEKCWNRKLSIEDPIVTSSNLSRCASSNKICDYIVDRLKSAYLYFSTPQSLSGPIYDGIADETTIDNDQVFCRTVVLSPEIEPNDFVPRQLKIINPLDRHTEMPSTFRSSQIIELPIIYQYHFNHRQSSFILKKSVAKAHNFLRRCEYNYNFDDYVRLDNTKPPMVCKACGAESHIRRDCPEETLPLLKGIVYPSQTSVELLSQTMSLNFHKVSLNTVGQQIRLQILEEIQSLLMKDFPDVKLTLFGSSKNGFGLKGSDIDVCMTLNSFQYSNKESLIKYMGVNGTLMHVVNALRRSDRLSDILSITSAKVPIVKFRCKAYKLEGDISLYNILAVHNTALLYSYTQLDQRVQILGCFLKKLGKLCDISDASKGSLSSYAYILMLIHYLQHVKNPVLPVLQEISPIGLGPGESRPVRLIDNSDAYFFDNLSQIKQVWPGWNQNTDSVVDLWLGFLRYYIEEFDFEKHVITISQFNSLTRQEKGWYTNCIAIEDPFDKSHNLGAGLSRRMSVHIMKTLRRFREVFHSDVPGITLTEAYNFYLDPTKLREGNPPIDRQCRLCYRIGHFAKNCKYYGKATDDGVVADEVDEEDVPVVRVEQTTNLRPMPSNLESIPPRPGFDRVVWTTPIIQSHRANVNVCGDVRPAIPMAFPFQLMGTSYLPSVHNPKTQFPPAIMRNGCFHPTNVIEAYPILNGYTFFWNTHEIQDPTAGYLRQLVNMRSGVSFADDLLRKAELIKMEMGITPRITSNAAVIPGGYVDSGYPCATQSATAVRAPPGFPPLNIQPRTATGMTGVTRNGGGVPPHAVPKCGNLRYFSLFGFPVAPPRVSFNSNTFPAPPNFNIMNSAHTNFATNAYGRHGPMINLPMMMSMPQQSQNSHHRTEAHNRADMN